MSKKSTRNVSKPAAIPAADTIAKTSTRTRLTTTEFNPDYSAIKSDLKRIGILAGSFFVILIVLSFFLR